MYMIEKLFFELANMDKGELEQKTGCKEPCTYLQVSVIERSTDNNYMIPHLKISFDRDLIEKKEHLIYDILSLIGEVGGAVGLLTGASFLSLWEMTV